MDMHTRDTFTRLWSKYFGGAELPITFYYTDEEGHAQSVEPESVSRCVIGALTDVRKGNSLYFDADSIGCPGGKRYLGFAEGIMPGFEYFLSYGIPGRLEGERYCKSPELVKEIMKNTPTFQAPGRFIVFKRWDRLEESDNPEVVIFYAKPDVLSGLFTLARFDEVDRNAVSAPFGSGCSTIVQYPYLEKDSEHPKAIVGMFDPSARPFVPPDVITLSVPISKFTRMIDNMEESFLITNTWSRMRKRIDSV
ncbi:MAG: DUF169 domain-containing protein [Dehalococcoidales bacterium]|nr:MAG: DUF169 domain-containing protein [Dehalococcoidales bacterium]